MKLATNSQNTKSDDALYNYRPSRVKASSLARRRRLTVLTRLILHESDEITDDGVQYCIASLSPHLEHLDLGRCSNLSGTRMTTTTAAPSLQRLRYLDLSECTEFTDAGLLHVGSMHHLEELELHGCRSITDSGLSSLHHLMHLNIWGCRKVTDVGLAYLAPLTHLQTLNIRLCDQVTDFGRCVNASAPAP
ncbi:receptor-type protein kinase, putative [Bodo saltans]|uniref:Receptor-type protein kinase, putative n=1 Tax=Bodo saltans TaxID=75058 RepID=A0A0S4IXR4_BODSA|nr:receptor-type protein kinase, putative [Bodo saltans]|eukprot:CUG06602.1 receptor-type protein kinase, putative [Bodo saltans]